MAFPDDLELNYEEAQRADSLFPPSERPTANYRLRRTEAVIKENPEYALGQVMAEVVRLRKEVNRLNNGTNFGKGPFQYLRESARPHVQTAGVGAGAATIVAIVIEILHRVGILK